MAKAKGYRKAVRLIIEKDSKILIGWRYKEDGKTLDYYLFPGGGIEDGESVEEAAIKEAKEEVGILVDNVRALGYEVKYDKDFDKPERAAKYRGSHDIWVAASYIEQDSELHGSEGDSFKFNWMTVSEAIAAFLSTREDKGSLGKIAALKAYQCFVAGVTIENYKPLKLPSW